MARESKSNRAIRRQLEQHAKPIRSPQEASETIAFQHTRTLSGPLPSPEILAEYEKAAPGSADRIIQMTEKEMAHRHMLETTAIAAQSTDIKAQRSEVRIGQFGAMLIATVAMSIGAYAATHGAQTFGCAVGGSTVIALVSAFLYRQHIVNKPAEQPKQADENEIAIPPLQQRIDE